MKSAPSCRSSPTSGSLPPALAGPQPLLQQREIAVEALAELGEVEDRGLQGGEQRRRVGRLETWVPVEVGTTEVEGIGEVGRPRQPHDERVVRATGAPWTSWCPSALT